MLLALLFGGLLVAGQAFRLQVLESGRWAGRAAEQHRQRVTLPAPRGTIYDRNGVPLAGGREAFRIAVAPRELTDRAAAAERLQEVLGVSAADARAAVSADRRWVVLPGVHGPRALEQLDGQPGIHAERITRRSYPIGRVAAELLGAVDAEGQALSGLELELDSLLAGRPGLAVARRDARGRPIPGVMITVAEPAPGADVHVTLDADLQAVAEQALADAIRETGASGGDLVMADPRTGDVLAAVSRRGAGTRHWTAATEPYEPGSTMKPFVVAALLAEGRATLADTVEVNDDVYVPGGRTNQTVDGYGSLTLVEALQRSSNVEVATAAARLEPAEHYRYLRAFGFGSPTGVHYPSETAGLLRRPSDWSAYSQGSLAVGYEIAVTPLQLTMAYAALANGGVLMEPRLVREVRPAGGVKGRHLPARTIRRVVPESAADAVAEALAHAVEVGTGREASFGIFRLAGKTGTAWRFESGRYGRGDYTSSFAGFFPAQDPQLVFLVKLDRPQGAYFGGQTAAPVVRSLLAAALAARNTPIDRAAVLAATLGAERAADARSNGVPMVPPADARSARPNGAPLDGDGAPLNGERGANGEPGANPAGVSAYETNGRPADAGGLAGDDGDGRRAGTWGTRRAQNGVTVMPSAPGRAAAPPAPGAIAPWVGLTNDFATRASPGTAGEPWPVVLALGPGPGQRSAPEPEGADLVVVDVRGLSLREAAKRLHAQGLRVEVEGSGEVRSMAPAGGSRMPAGSVVRIRGG